MIWNQSRASCFTSPMGRGRILSVAKNSGEGVGPIDRPDRFTSPRKAGRGIRTRAPVRPKAIRPAISEIEHGHGADRRSGAVAPLHRQADEGERALAEQRFQVAQALD